MIHTHTHVHTHTKHIFPFTHMKKQYSHPTVLLFKASCSRAQMSSPTTPSQRNPLVHLDRRALAIPSWRHGKEKVKPRGRVCPDRLWSRTNFPMQSAMWSNNCTQEEKTRFTCCLWPGRTFNVVKLLCAHRKVVRFRCSTYLTLECDYM